MATSRRERLKQELREEILSAARDLFVEEGYVSVSMRRIAEHVGCAPGTIYLYFEDKNAILSAICVETFNKLDKRMEAIAKDRSNPLDRLRRAGRLYVQFGLDHPEHYYITFGIAGIVGGDDGARSAGLRSFDCLRTGVKEAIDAGQLRFDDPDEVAQAIWASMHGIVMLLIAKKSFPFVEQSRLIDRVIDVAIEGIRQR